MTRLQRVRASGDDGASLVMALVFLLIVGVFASAALDKSASTTLSGSSLRDRGMLQYALDGGVERGLDVLQDDLQSGSPSLCTSAAATATDVTGVRDGTTLELNGHAVRYSCQTLAGRTGGDSDDSRSNYALVLTDEAPGALTTQSGSSTPLVIGGSLYLAGKLSDEHLKKPVDVRGGSVVQLQDNCDRDQLRSLTQLSVDDDQLRECTEQTVEQAIPAVDVPAAPATPTVGIDYPLPLPEKSKGAGSGGKKAAECRVFLPGLLNEPPALLTGKDTTNWFIGGTYHFDFTGTTKKWTIPNGATVVGASTSEGEVVIPPNCPKLTDVTGAESASGGATFVFGGTSTLGVQGALLMATPEPEGGGPPVSILTARTQDAADGYTPWSADGAVLLDTANATSSVVLKGKLVAPDAAASLFASNPTTAMLQRGAVLHRLSLGASVAAEAIAVTADGDQQAPPPTFRTLRVVATDAGGSTARQTAVVSISNFSPHTVTVHSWRSE